MGKHSIDDLRAHLFETLAELRDKEAPMEIDRAKAIVEVSQAIINSAKAETDYVRATGGVGHSAFMQPIDPSAQLTGPNVRVHRLKG